MISSIALLEPYRSALMTIGYDDGLVKVSEGIDWTSSSAYMIGKNKELQQRVMMLSLLFDQIVIVNHETQKGVEYLESQGHGFLSARKLQENGIVEFAETTLDEERVNNLKKMQSIEDWWRIEKDLIETWKPLIISQMFSRGKLPHPTIFDFLQIFRSGDQAESIKAAQKIPKEYSGFMTEMFNKDLPLPYDVIVFSTLNEILDVDQIASKSNVKIAIDGNFPKMNDSGSIPANNADQLFNIIIETLLEEELRFPIPENLIELKSVREIKNISSFRSVFQPWLNSLGKADNGEEPRLRKEVKKAIKQFKIYPKLSFTSNLSAIVALPVGFMGPIGAIIGAGLGVTSLGLSRLANQWKTRNAWVGICA